MTLIALLALTSCTRSTPNVPPAATAAPFLPQASVRELMDAEVDPSADVLWESVVYTVTAEGADDKQPRTPEEWQAVRRGAITLIEAMNLLMMDGRAIAAPGTPLATGEANIEVRQHRLDSNRAPFVGFAQVLQKLGLKALAAIDARDAQQLVQVGGEIDEACEACHLVYWYPPEPKTQR
jgi:hypothetical protein